jgi:hypothetical protein
LRFVVVQPGYPGSTGDAAGFLRRLAAYLEKKTGIQGLQGTYYNETKPVLAALKSSSTASSTAKTGPAGKTSGPVALGVVSVGFYLEHRHTFGMKALLESRPHDNFVVVARHGDLKKPADLKGEPVAGGPLHERLYLERTVFAKRPGGGVNESAENPSKKAPSLDIASWRLVPTLRASRALRNLLRRKKYRAVVVTGTDYRVLSQLYRAKTLEKIAESEYYPTAFVVAFGKAAAAATAETAEETLLSVEETKEVEGAFLGLSRDPEGKGILETMGAEGFAAIRAGWLKELEGDFDAQSEEK